MFNRIIFYRDLSKLLFRVIIIFISFYSIIIAIAVYINFSYFLIFVPIVVTLVFLFSKKLLLEISFDESNQTIEFVFLQFVFFKRRQIFKAADITYSYQEEQTSRLAYNYVFKVICTERLVFSRYHDLDGMNENDVDQIISEFKSFGIKEIK